MKIYAINKVNNNRNIGFESTNKTTKIGVGLLITASSLFMFSNAIDSFSYENSKDSSFMNMDIPASIIGMVGTYMSLIGLKKDEEDKNNSGGHQYR